jgi:hypothetical protein
MAINVHLEGSDFVINLDQVIDFLKTKSKGQPAISFNKSDGNTDEWEFESEEQRDKVFLGLIHTDKGRTFSPAAIKGFSSGGPVFL